MYSKIREALLQKSGAQNVSPGAGTGYKLQFFIPSGGGERSALEPAPQALLDPELLTQRPLYPTPFHWGFRFPLRHS